MAVSKRKAAHDFESRRRTGDVFAAERVDFSSLLLSQPVLEGLSTAGFERPSPIQLKAIPLGRCGLDLIVQAKSGTGKTCVFATIALDTLLLENPATQILVLAPTREIAVQIHSVICAIGVKVDGLECHAFIGGMPLSQDKARLKKCHIAVGSPGRIKQLIEMGYLNTASVRLFVLDEADKLLEEGSFQEQINWIYSSLPANKQMLALSATYPESLAQHLTQYMRDPAFVRLNPSDPGLIGLKQYCKLVNSYPLPHKVFEEKVKHLMELFSKIPFNQALVFSNLHSRAQHLADILTSKGLPAICISGNMNQNQRLEAMTKLKQFHCRVLITTDLTSRGIDAERVNLVVNLDVPQDWETYMHRIGRAGRFGTYGLAITYCCRGQEENEMMTIAQKCNLQISDLPDPIPPGLMEEVSEWNVEVTTVKSGNSVSNVPESKTVETGASVSDKECADQSQNIIPAAKNEMSKKNNSLKQKHLEEAKTEQSQKKVTNMGPKGLGRGLQQKVTCSLILPKIPKPDATEDLKILQDSLPKIPSLPSFKNKIPLQCTLNFDELVKDYDLFIKEGIESHVEFTREYTDMNGGNGILNQNSEELEISSLLESEQNKILLSDQHSECDSESDSFSSRSSYSSRESRRSSVGFTHSTMDTKTEKEPVMGTSALPQTSPSPPELRPSVSQVCSHDQLFTEVGSETYPEFPTSSPQRQLNEASIEDLNPVNSGTSCKSLKPKKKKHKGHVQDCSDSPAQQVNTSALHHKAKNHSSGGHQNAQHLTEKQKHDYWKACYHAWQSYYTAMSNPFFRSSQRNPHLMRAYQMNSVYLNELLKK
ncbi:probable ATP-dependent RNA helicase DDX20 [Protopterus annectens]|uniref:probable ATP-dependent RNA helicase DDX20 n=1 Tax=Protopterus annectens TaxID=7888 RepID=UPI001CF971E7|nr:probable ATP-dependent RNA helicase DDX20 [Protopterus annectens]